MAQEKKTKVKEQEVSVQVPAVLTDSALGLVRNGNRMEIVRIKYNPKTKEVGELEVIATEEEQRSGEERLKISLVKERILT